MDLSIVVPCYNEEDVLRETAASLLQQLERLRASEKISRRSRVYFVDDGSRDRTWAVIEELAQESDLVRGIKLARNRGQQSALMAGLMIAEGDAVVSIDADLQDDVSAIEQMVDAYREGHDVVYGVRASRRSDRIFKRWCAETYYRLLRLIGIDVVFNHADFRLLGRKALEALREFGEVNLYLRGVVPLVGFRSTCVYYARSKRLAGETKYPLHKSIALGIDGITSFSAVPLRLITILGLLMFVVSSSLGVWALGIKLLTEQAVPGWASTAVPLYLLGGMQLLCVGVIGEYLGKVYIEVKARPRYTIDKVV